MSSSQQVCSINFIKTDCRPGCSQYARSPMDLGLIQFMFLDEERNLDELMKVRKLSKIDEVYSISHSSRARLG